MATRSIPPVRFNRIVQLQRRTVSRDNFGSEIEEWSEVAKVWASVDQTGTSEDFKNDANRTLALRSAQITIRWRPDVTELWRVIYGGLIWDVEGIQAQGRRVALTLFYQTDVHRKVSPGDSTQRSPEPKPPVEPSQKPPPPRNANAIGLFWCGMMVCEHVG